MFPYVLIEDRDGSGPDYNVKIIVENNHIDFGMIEDEQLTPNKRYVIIVKSTGKVISDIGNYRVYEDD